MSSILYCTTKRYRALPRPLHTRGLALTKERTEYTVLQRPCGVEVRGVGEAREENGRVGHAWEKSGWVRGGCGEGGGWWWMDEGDRRCVYVWREEGCVGLSRRRPAVRGPLQKGGSHGRAPSRGLARKMPAHAAHKVQGKCDASGQEGGEGHSTRWGKRGAAVGDGGCGVRACAGGAAAGPGGVPSRAQKSTVLDAKVPANERAGQELSG